VFIAPEQALGKKRLDGRVDIYATGCVAYWLLTGELVFKAETGMGLLMEHVDASPAAPSSRQPIRQSSTSFFSSVWQKILSSCLSWRKN